VVERMAGWGAVGCEAELLHDLVDESAELIV
jgi:hypothetical protein